jgi:COMPASS component SWD3
MIRVKLNSHHLLASVPAADASVRLYNVTSAPFTTPTLSPRFDFAHAHDSGINDLVFTRDDKFVLTASDDKTIILWDLELRKPVKTFKGHTNYVFCLAVNSGGDACVSGSYDETLRIWDMKNARCTRVICAHSDPISAVDFNKSGTLIVSSSCDGLCRVWDAQSGRCLKTIYNENTPPVSVKAATSSAASIHEIARRAH